MKIELFTDFDQILLHANQWNDVAAKRPFFRTYWMLNWLQHRVDAVTPAVLVGKDENDKWIGIAPFCVESKSLTQKLRLLGSGTVCSDYLGLIARPSEARRFAESVADWLSNNLRHGGPLGTIDVVELEGIDPTDANNIYFCELLEASRFKSHAVELEGCWVVDLPDAWEAMDASLSKSLRRKTKKAVQRLSEPQTEILSSDTCDIAELWPVFVELHQKRRKMLGQSGCFADSNFESFLRASTTELIAAGRAELVVVNHANHPLACALFFNDGETNFMYQSGMDSERISLEPGYQLAVLGLQISIRKGLKRFDFLRGDEPYKSRWLTTRIPMYRTRFIPPNFGSQLKHKIWTTAFSLKQWYKPAVPSVSDVNQE